jgi:hypothetical protein
VSGYTVQDVPLGFAPVPPELVMWTDENGKPLGGTEIRLWSLLAMHRHLKTATTRAGTVRMADMLGVDRTTAQRAANRLQAAGFLAHKPRSRDPETGEWRPATFVLCVGGKPIQVGVVTVEEYPEEADDTGADDAAGADDEPQDVGRAQMHTQDDHHDASAPHHDAHHDASAPRDSSLNARVEEKEEESGSSKESLRSSLEAGKEPAPAEKEKPYDSMTLGEKQSYFVAYLHRRLDERGHLDDKPLTGPMRKRYAGEIAAHINKGHGKARILLALDHVVFRWPEDRVAFSEAFDSTGRTLARRHLSALPGGAGSLGGTPSAPGGGLRELS